MLVHHLPRWLPRSSLLALPFTLVSLSGCVGPGIAPDEPLALPLSLMFTDLPDLGADYVYEGWLIVDEAPVATGRFSVTPEQQNVEVQLDRDTFAAATTFVLTIEPAFGDDPAPSAVHLLAGDIDNSGKANLSTAHPAALGTDFATAMGGYLLETPTSADEGDYDQGLWFLDVAGGPGPSLALPPLPEGWVYEGWVVIDDTPTSTGRFTDVGAADDDGAGPSAGPNAAPPFPGQDFISPARTVVGGTVVISVEPEPDNSPMPFALKPLVDDVVEDVGAGVLQPMGTNAGLPLGIAELGAR